MEGIWIIYSGMAFLLCFMEIDQIAEKLLWGKQEYASIIDPLLPTGNSLDTCYNITNFAFSRLSAFRGVV
jgi:hypothetical protein